jgi:Holliday junction DNA helicase RuvA
MIARIQGELVESGDGYVVVVAGGVGYEVFVTQSVQVSLPEVGSKVDLHIRQIVRENEIALFGFGSKHERRLFDLLTTVNGLGPRLGLSLLSSVGEAGVIGAILSGDYKPLVRAQGIGAKLAQRICVELADKVREESVLGRIGVGAVSPLDDVVEALISLGLKRGEAERAAKMASDKKDTEDTAELVSLALKFAGKN